MSSAQDETVVKPSARKVRPLKEGSRFFRFVVWILGRTIDFKCYRYSQNEELIPETGPAIVIAPHLGSIDAFIAPEVVTRAGRMPRILAKSSLWNIPVVKQAFNSGKLIPVDRTKSASDSLIAAKEALEEGDVVFIFPEGTFTKDPDFWPMTCKTGAARLALMTGVPVIPILQDGEQFLVKGYQNRTDLPYFDKYHYKNRVLVHLNVFEPLDFSDIFTGAVLEPTEEQIEQVNFRIEDALTKIVADSRGVEAPLRWDARQKRRVERGNHQ